MALIVITPTATAGAPATRTPSSAARTATPRWASAIRFGAGFVDVQCAPTQFLAVEGGNGLLGLPHGARGKHVDLDRKGTAGACHGGRQKTGAQQGFQANCTFRIS